jgi:hypothetical protein
MFNDNQAATAQNNQNDEVQIFQTDASQLVEAQEKAATDVQITTAKAYPRDLKKTINDAIVTATIDNETAQACGYDLPRGNKFISGASVHLARILAQCYGNIRVQFQVKHITQKQVIAEAVAWDLEKNYAVKAEVRKRITDKYGKRFNDDMITVTGNAASAIAERNAILRVLPAAISNKVYKETRNFLAGDMSDESKVLKRRTQAIEYFKNQYGVNEAQICEALGVNTTNAIKQNEVVRLLGIDQAIKDGDTTVRETFGETERGTNAEQKSTNKNGASKTNKSQEKANKAADLVNKGMQ